MQMNGIKNKLSPFFSQNKISFIALILSIISLILSFKQYSLGTGSNSITFWGNIRLERNQINTQNRILRSQLSSYIHTLELIKREIHNGKIENKKIDCTKFDRLSNEAGKEGMLLDNTIEKIWNEYLLTVITERANATVLSINGWKGFSNETPIEHWITYLRVLVISQNTQITDSDWICATSKLSEIDKKS